MERLPLGCRRLGEWVRKECAFKNAKRVFSLIYGFTNLLLAGRLEHQAGVGVEKLEFALRAYVYYLFMKLMTMTMQPPCCAACEPR